MCSTHNSLYSLQSSSLFSIVHPSVYICLSACASISVCLSVRTSTHPSMSFCLDLFIHPPVCRSICLPVYPASCLSLSSHPTVCPSIHLFLSVCPSIRPSVHPSQSVILVFGLDTVCPFVLPIWRLVLLIYLTSVFISTWRWSVLDAPEFLNMVNTRH